MEKGNGGDWIPKKVALITDAISWRMCPYEYSNILYTVCIILSCPDMLYKYLAWLHVDASQNQKGKQAFCGNVLGSPRDVGFFMRSFSMIVRSRIKTVDRFNILNK